MLDSYLENTETHIPLMFHFLKWSVSKFLQNNGKAEDNFSLFKLSLSCLFVCGGKKGEIIYHSSLFWMTFNYSPQSPQTWHYVQFLWTVLKVILENSNISSLMATCLEKIRRSCKEHTYLNVLISLL